MTREDFVLAYKMKDTYTVYCRICMLFDIRNCDDMFASDYKHCCCRALWEANGDWIKFNNQKAIPLVFSDGSCFLKSHNLCNMSSCRENMIGCEYIR